MSGDGAADGDTEGVWEVLGPGQAASFFHPRSVARVIGTMETRRWGWVGRRVGPRRLLPPQVPLPPPSRSQPGCPNRAREIVQFQSRVRNGGRREEAGWLSKVLNLELKLGWRVFPFRYTDHPLPSCHTSPDRDALQFGGV